MINTNPILLVVALAGALITFLFSRWILNEYRLFPHTTLISFITAMLGFLGLLVMGDFIIYLILLPFAALTLTILLMLFIRVIGRWSAGSNDQRHARPGEVSNQRQSCKTSPSSNQPKQNVNSIQVHKNESHIP